MFGCLNYHTVLLQLLVQCMYFISVLFQYCKDKVGTKHDPSQVPNEKFKTVQEVSTDTTGILFPNFKL